MKSLRALFKLCLLLMLTVALMPFQLVLLLVKTTGLDLKRQSPIVRLWFRVTLWILKIDITIVNKRLLDKGQKLYLCNHISYLDIIVLGAKFNGFFVAKSDIAHWPVMGFLSKISGTIFIVRQRRHVQAQLDLLRQHLEQNQSLILFPEGTTGDGRTILPFKSSLLKSAYAHDRVVVPIQPLSLIYTHLNCKKLIAADEFDTIAWYGEMTLAPHLWRLLKQKSLSAKIVIHQQITNEDHLNSKQVTAKIQNEISETFDIYR